MKETLGTTIENTPSPIITIPDGKICDYIDGKFRNDTPEEYVRQNIEKRLVNELKYSKDRIKVEYGVKVGSSRPRADIVIFPEGCENFSQEYIKLIIESKKESVEPTSKKEGVEQLKSYMSACPNGFYVKKIFKNLTNSQHTCYNLLRITMRRFPDRVSPYGGLLFMYYLLILFFRSSK